MSRHLYIDLNLSMDNIEKDCLQVLLVGEGRLPILLTLYNLEDPGKSEAPHKLQQQMLTFSRSFAEELSKQLRELCGVSIVILPCAMPFKTFSKVELEREVERQREHLEGLEELSEEGYKKMAEATASLASTSYVPYILNKNNDEVHALSIV